MRSSMQIAVINLSPRINDSDVHLLAAAAQRHLVDVAQLWRRVPLPVVVLRPKDPLGSAVWPIYLRGSLSVPDALGDHDVTSDGRPRGEVGLSEILDSGGTLFEGADSVSACLTHEAAEIDGDEFASFWADMPLGTPIAPRATQICLELCDPVEMDVYHVQIGKQAVAVSNFVGPAYFNAGAPKGSRFDMMGKLAAPFTMTKGGYLILRNADGSEDQTFADGAGPAGDLWKAWRVAKKAHKLSRTSRRRAAPSR